MYKMNQLNRPEWIFLTQYNPYTYSSKQNFQNNFYSSQSQWGFTSPELNFHSPYPQSYPDFAYYIPFSEPSIEEKSELEKIIEVLKSML